VAGGEGEESYHCDVGAAARPVGTRSGPVRAAVRPLSRRRGGGRDGREREIASGMGGEGGEDSASAEGNERTCGCGHAGLFCLSGKRVSGFGKEGAAGSVEDFGLRRRSVVHV
jgi:hypothetical protein